MEAIADADVASVAALMGDRARCAMLTVLIDGSERPAGELAKAAGVSAATASGHLRRLVAGGLVTVRSSGRHRYYGPLLAEGVLSVGGTRDFELTDRGHRLLQELGLDAEPILRSRRMLARDCLDWTERKPHLAGSLPAALLARFVELGWLDRRRNDRGLTITHLGHANLPTLGRPSDTVRLLKRASR
jgi:DNA-binding transcriptional ArsR family regulator